MSSPRRPPGWILPLVAAACVAAACPAGAQVNAKLIQGHSEVHLDNGMTVILQEDHRVPTVTLVLRYDLGAAVPEEGREAARWVVTSLMVERSQQLGSGEASRLFARAGAGSWNDQSSPEAVMLSITLPAPTWAR